MPKINKNINKKEVIGAPLPPRPRRKEVHARPAPQIDPDARYSAWHSAELLDELVQCWRVARPEARAIIEQDLKELLKALKGMKNKGF